MKENQIEKLRKDYNLTDEQMEEIRNALEITSKLIALARGGEQTSYENRIARIVGQPEGFWYAGEDVAQAFYEQGKWQIVFETFYKDDVKFSGLKEE